MDQLATTRFMDLKKALKKKKNGRTKALSTNVLANLKKKMHWAMTQMNPKIEYAAYIKLPKTVQTWRVSKAVYALKA